MKQLALAFAALALAACSSAQSLSEGERLAYRCAGGKEFSLRYAAGAAEVYAAGQTHRLPETGDGAYSNGAITYTENGNTSLVGAPGGPYENCRRRGLRGLLPF